jgi:hypothetical protein
MSKKAIDLTGLRFHRLTVVNRAPNAKNSSRTVRWNCICDCEITTIVSSQALRNNKIKSCGCYRAELLTQGNVIHGMTGTPEFKTWEYMRRRVKLFSDYAQRGMDPTWMTSFQSFYSHLMLTIGPHPGFGYSIDRVNNERGYFPDNVRWATMKEQANNRRKKSK